MQTAARAYHAVAVQCRRDELILSHLSVVRHVLGKLRAELPPGVDVENLEAAGTLGLVEAASHFDPSRGVPFETYARARVRGAMLDELRRNCALPQAMLQHAARVRQACRALPGPATVEALAAATGLREDEVSDCLAAMRLLHIISWDSSHESRAAYLAERQDQPGSRAERDEQRQLLARAVEALPERERLVITLYYLEDLRLKEIGQLLGLSESRVSRVLNAALFHLAELVRASETES